MGKIVCIGGLKGLRNESKEFISYSPRKVDTEIIKLSNKKHPKVLFKIAYESLGSNVAPLLILDNDITYTEILNTILSADIIYVGCGNTQFMLDKWKEKGVDIALKKAYEQGTVLAGMSAGSYCWFSYNYDLIEGLGLIKAINCVHYDLKDDLAKKKFYNVIKNKNMTGVALEDCTALAVIDNNFKIIKNNKDAKAYKIFFDGNKFIEEELK